MKKMAKAAALLAAALVLFACKNIEEGGEIQPPAPEQGSGGSGGEQKPGGNGNSGDEEGEAGGETVLYKDLADFFTKEYPAEFSGVTQSTSITLTAQTIKDVVEKTPAFETQVKAVNTDTARDAVIAEFNKITDENVRKAIMAQAAGKLNITKGTKSLQVHIDNTATNTSNDFDAYNISNISLQKLSLSGDFDIYTYYISSLSNDVDISDVTFVSNKKVINNLYVVPTKELKDIYDTLKLKEKDSNKLPTLNFKIYNATGNYEGLKHFLNIYEKYNESTKMQITGNFSSTPFDGSKLVANSGNYTLFSDDNTAKESTKAKDVKSMNINTLVKFSNKYNVKNIKNIIVSGTPSAGSSVDWTNLTNVIFEGDMSNLKINNNMSLDGIVYFKNFPYNNSNVGYVNGAVRLEQLKNTISLNLSNGVLDLRNIDTNAMSSYINANHYISLGDTYAIYFNNTLVNTEKPYSKIVREGAAYVIHNAYFGTGTRQNSYNSSGNHPGAKTARSLKEFEYYGNYDKYEKSAYSTYSSDTDIKNTGASDTGVTNLKNDINKKLIAKNNKNIDFIRAEGLIPRRFAS